MKVFSYTVLGRAVIERGRERGRGEKRTMATVMLSQPIPSLSVSAARQYSHNCSRENSLF